MEKTILYRHLEHQRYAVVSSLSSLGAPQSALVGIAVTPELEIVFDTLKTSRKYPNLIHRPLCSLVIGGDEERTVQLEGLAFEPQGLDLVRYRTTYFAAWPDGRARMNWPAIAYLVVRPRWIRFSDFHLNPPYTEETCLAD